MVLHALDWSIVGVFLAFMIGIVLISRSQMKSVADFLAAGRTAGRYLITVSSGVAALGAITVIGTLEMNLQAGFSLSWWGMTMTVVILLATAAGWVIYRFRQTRCLTLAQFFELRYSRRFRIFAGLIAFLAGIVNMGIFPAVEARFFMYFCGFPSVVHIAGLAVSTFALIMAILLAIALFFVFAGGQIAVIASDFLQGVFVNVGLLVIVLYFVFTVDWGVIEQALHGAPANASLINPFHTSQVRDFNLWYFLIGVFGYLYGTMSWQGTQAYNASAENAHEAKMAGLLGNWRLLPQTLMLTFVPIIAYTVLNHPSFASVVNAIQPALATAETEAVRSQLKAPLVLQQLLPRGLIGIFAALMLAASITTFDTYLHSWGSILVQDVIIPWRGRPLGTRRHLWALRLAILFVAIFIFGFSLIFRQTQYIFLFFAITGAIFAGGSGAVIIGGLYWKRGTAPAAWAAMITGSAIAVGGIVIHQIHEGFFINGQEFWAIAMGASTLVFIGVSLLGRRRVYDLDRLLHRGTYAVAVEGDAPPEPHGWRALWYGKDFTRGDRIIYFANCAWALGWFAVFVVGTIQNLTHAVADDAWFRFWKIWLWIQIAMSAITVVWFSTGGFLDLRRMFRRLQTRERDHADDGFVRREESRAVRVEGGTAPTAVTVPIFEGATIHFSPDSANFFAGPGQTAEDQGRVLVTQAGLPISSAPPASRRS
jgi:SSS family solute:Na+ symporter